MTLVLLLWAKGLKVNQYRVHNAVPRRITTHEKVQMNLMFDNLL
jgi:hypothetical protein